jgi:hypothetical protein
VGAVISRVFDPMATGPANVNEPEEILTQVFPVSVVVPEMVLKPVEIVSAIDAALAEAGGQPSPFPDGADARTFFVHGLYDEIVQQPSNLFETRVFPDGSERYVPVGRAVWVACLERVKAGILKAKVKG